MKLAFRNLSDKERDKIPSGYRGFMVIDIPGHGEYLLNEELYFNNGDYIYHFNSGNYLDLLTEYMSLVRFNKWTMKTDYNLLPQDNSVHTITCSDNDKEIECMIKYIVENFLSLNIILG